MRKDGQITIFLSFIIMCIFSLILSLTESARMAGARFYYQTAINGAMDSLFSRYHVKLWEQYRILGMNTKEEMKSFEKYFKDFQETENWYIAEEKEASVLEKKVLTDDGGQYLEAEILEYMKLGIWNMEWDSGSVTEIYKELQEARAVSQVTEEFSLLTKEAWSLEQCIEDIKACLDSIESQRKSGISELQKWDGRGFLREGKGLKKDLEKLPGLVSRYERKADDFGKKLNQAEITYEEKSAQMSEDTRSWIKAEIAGYRQYTDEAGARRKEIKDLVSGAEFNKALTEETMEQAEEVMEYIDSWEPVDEEEDLDEGGLWEPVIQHFSQFRSLTISFQSEIKDKETKGILERLKDTLNRGILEWVMPENREVSAGRLDITDFPSLKNQSSSKSGSEIGERLLVLEYCSQFYHNFCRFEEKPVLYEMEYLWGGRFTDEDNLEETVKTILEIRWGMNFLGLIRDSSKRDEARLLAAAIAGITGMAPIVEMTAYFIMGVWALAEAASDVKTLLSGGKVPVMKSPEEWNLSLQGVIALGAGGELPAGSGERGFSYEYYLKFLLLFLEENRLYYRMMDVMQMNVRREDKGFRMEDSIYFLRIQQEMEGRHRFFFSGKDYFAVIGEKAY